MAGFAVKMPEERAPEFVNFLDEIVTSKSRGVR